MTRLLLQNFLNFHKKPKLFPITRSYLTHNIAQSFSGFTRKAILYKKMIKTMSIYSGDDSETPMSLRDNLLCKVADVTKDGMDKVTVVGAGTVGISCANAILFQKISSHVAIVDAFSKKLKGEGLDYSHSSVFIGDPNIEYDTDFCISKNSKVIIIAAGARQMEDESRLDLVSKNVEIIKSIIPPLIENSPNAVILLVSNPVDILSWVTWKMSDLPINRILGVGCHLDTARFRYLISQRLGISSKSVHGFIIGEHGDSQVPLWSGVNVAGVLFRDILPDIGLDLDEQGWNELINDLIKAGSTVRSLKGYSNTAIGLATADITKAILKNKQTVKSVSTLAQGHYGICHEMFLSLPCIIGDNGVTQVIRMRMTEHEKKQLQKSASILYDIQKNIKVS